MFKKYTSRDTNIEKENYIMVIESKDEIIKKMQKKIDVYIEKDIKLNLFLNDYKFKDIKDLIDFVNNFKNHKCINTKEYIEIVDQRDMYFNKLKALKRKHDETLKLNSTIIEKNSQLDHDQEKLIININGLNEKLIRSNNKINKLQTKMEQLGKNNNYYYIGDIVKKSFNIDKLYNIIDKYCKELTFEEICNIPLPAITEDELILLSNSNNKNKKYIKEINVLKEKEKKLFNIIDIEKKYMRLDNYHYVEYINYLYSIYYEESQYYKLIEKESRKKLKKLNPVKFDEEEKLNKSLNKCNFCFITNENKDIMKIINKTFVNKIKNEYEIKKEMELKNFILNDIIEYKIKYNNLENISSQKKTRIKNNYIRCSKIYAEFGDRLINIKFNISNMIDMHDKVFNIWFDFLKQFMNKHFP